MFTVIKSNWYIGLAVSLAIGIYIGSLYEKNMLSISNKNGISEKETNLCIISEGFSFFSRMTAIYGILPYKNISLFKFNQIYYNTSLFANISVIYQNNKHYPIRYQRILYKNLLNQGNIMFSSLNFPIASFSCSMILKSAEICMQFSGNMTIFDSLSIKEISISSRFSFVQTVFQIIMMMTALSCLNEKVITRSLLFNQSTLKFNCFLLLFVNACSLSIGIFGSTIQDSFCKSFENSFLSLVILIESLYLHLTSIPSIITSKIWIIIGCMMIFVASTILFVFDSLSDAFNPANARAYDILMIIHSLIQLFVSYTLFRMNSNTFCILFHNNQIIGVICSLFRLFDQLFLRFNRKNPLAYVSFAKMYSDMIILLSPETQRVIDSNSIVVDVDFDNGDNTDCD